MLLIYSCLCLTYGVEVMVMLVRNCHCFSGIFIFSRLRHGFVIFVIFGFIVIFTLKMSIVSLVFSLCSTCNRTFMFIHSFSIPMLWLTTSRLRGTCFSITSMISHFIWLAGSIWHFLVQRNQLFPSTFPMPVYYLKTSH